jgi:hypothetical protein
LLGNPRITYSVRSDATPETELSALTAVYRYVLFDSQAKRGDPRDLTRGSTAEMTKKRTTENRTGENLTWRN